MIFIDASDQIRVGRAQNFLEPEHVNQIYKWYKEGVDVENYVKIASINDIKDNDFNLNIPLYVEKIIEDNLPFSGRSISRPKKSMGQKAKKQKKNSKTFLENLSHDPTTT